MSYEYALSRVHDALQQSGGNHAKAQRLIMSWLEKDQSLLAGLVTPHLGSIVTHALSKATQQPAAPSKIQPQPGETGEFGDALLASLKGGSRSSSGTFGEAAPRTVSKPGQASKAHVDAINTLVAAGKNKDQKTKK